MEWLAANWTWLVPTAILVAEKVAGLTKPTFKPFGIPVGEYDDMIIEAIKDFVKKAMGK